MSSLRERVEGLVATMPHNGARMFSTNTNELGHATCCYRCKLAAALAAEGQTPLTGEQVWKLYEDTDTHIHGVGCYDREGADCHEWKGSSGHKKRFIEAFATLAAAPSLHVSETAAIVPETGANQISTNIAPSLHKEGAGGDELCECGQPENSIRHSFTAASSVDAHEFKPSKLRYCGRCNQRRYFVDGKCEMCDASPAGRAEQEQK